MTEWINIGVITAEAARTHPRRHELTRALGQSPDVVVDLLPIELRPGDRLLLCSDGLHGYVSDSVIARALKSGSGQIACALVGGERTAVSTTCRSGRRCPRPSPRRRSRRIPARAHPSRTARTR
jgi:serine/threonine protein phosphatase PrpC